MGSFSFKTQDTNKSVWNNFDNQDEVFTVYLIAPDGTKYKEDNYGGYGEFGGKDIYELISEINGGPSCRSNGIKLAFENSPNGINPRIIWPNLVEHDSDYVIERGVIHGCPYQGHYGWQDEDEGEYY